MHHFIKTIAFCEGFAVCTLTVRQLEADLRIQGRIKIELKKTSSFFLLRNPGWSQNRRYCWSERQSAVDDLIADCTASGVVMAWALFGVDFSLRSRERFAN